VLLVRHGRTAVNAQGRLSGRHDPDLDEVGRRQAAALGEEVAVASFGAPLTVVSSPLGRCVQTARALMAACDIDGGGAEGEVPTDRRFLEMDYGDWDGRPISEVPPDAWRQWRDDPSFCPPGGETLSSVSHRVAEGITHLAPTAVGGTLVVVSHVSPIKAGVTWALGVGDEVTWRMRLDNASICRLAVSCGSDGSVRGALRSFNETAHLRSDVRGD